MSDKGICPYYKAAVISSGRSISDMRVIGLELKPEGEAAGLVECDGEACAWWDGDENDGTCAIYCLARLHELSGFNGGK